ncbi:MAG TPA: 4a-hydroxytetrahydrobiopterin dehydratase [Candidatus Yaniella excrementigallinarum]|nr:4a-hydroxytetrahydrobiopterin dehydratase [Candidatus Yaniella excrementigallinarum]
MTNVTSAQAQEQLPGWTVVDGRLEISVRAADFTKAIEFVNRFADIAEGMNHHPDFDIRYNTIRIRVVSHDVGGLTDRDTAFAGELDKLIDEMELKRQPKKISRSHLIFVTPNIDAIKPFWKAVFDFKEAEGSGQTDMLVDRSDVLSPIRFLQRPDSTIPVDDVDPSDGPVSMHVDVFVPAEFAVTRMQAAVEAGGKIINQADAPSMWELADLDGNRVFLRSQQPSD